MIINFTRRKGYGCPLLDKHNGWKHNLALRQSYASIDNKSREALNFLLWRERVGIEPTMDGLTPNEQF